MVQGYDARVKQFGTSDPLLGPRRAISYSEFNQIWAEPQNHFFVIYPDSKDLDVQHAVVERGWA